MQIAGLQHHVLGQGHVRDHSVAVAVRRAVADAKRYVLCDIQVSDVFPVQCDPARCGRQCAVEKFTQGILSVSGYTGYSQDLACMDLKVQVCQKGKFIFPLDRDVLDFEAHGFFLPVMLRPAEHLQVMTDHQPGQIRHLHFRLADRSADFSISHDHDPVRHLHDLPHFMRDKEYGIALRDKAADEFHQRIDLLRHQDGGRLVHDQDARVAVERFHDLYLLLHADRKVSDFCLCADSELVAVGQFLDLFLLRCIIDLASDIAEDDVFCNCMCSDKGKMLLDHGDSQSHGIPRRCNILLHSIDPDLSGCHMVDPVQDIHDRALAGSVLAQQRDDLSLVQRDGDIVVRQHLRKTLADVVDLNHRLYVLILFHIGSSSSVRSVLK